MASKCWGLWLPLGHSRTACLHHWGHCLGHEMFVPRSGVESSLSASFQPAWLPGSG